MRQDEVFRDDFVSEASVEECSHCEEPVECQGAGHRVDSVGAVDDVDHNPEECRAAEDKCPCRKQYCAAGECSLDEWKPDCGALPLCYDPGGKEGYQQVEGAFFKLSPVGGAPVVQVSREHDCEECASNQRIFAVEGHYEECADEEDAGHEQSGAGGLAARGLGPFDERLSTVVRHPVPESGQ